MSHANPRPRSLREAGFDEGLIEANLRLSAEERVLKHQAALDLAFALAASQATVHGRLEQLLERLPDAEIEFVIEPD